MAQELITNYDNFTASSISYGAPRTNARGGKSIKILDAKNNTLVLNTPLILTWGINKLVDDDTGRVSYNLALQYPSDGYGSDATKSFFEKMKAFESKILDDAVTHSKAWFNKPKMSREVAEALFTPMLKYPKDKATGEPDYSRAPTSRIKIPYWEGKFNTELYNIDETPIYQPGMELGSTQFETLIPKASHIAAAIQCNGIWFAAGKFGVTWQLVQAIVRRPVRIQGACFVKLSSVDHEEIENISRREAEESARTEVQSEFEDNTESAHVEVEDSDDEEEQAPPPPVEKKKKRVVKKSKKKAVASE